MVTEVLKRRVGFFDSFETREIRRLNRRVSQRPVLLEEENGRLRSQWDVFRQLREQSVFVVAQDLIGRPHIAGVMPSVRSRQANSIRHYPDEQAGVVSSARTALWLGAHLAAFDQGLLKESDIIKEYRDPKRGINPTSIDDLRGWLGNLVTQLHENKVLVIKTKRGVNPRRAYFTPQPPNNFSGMDKVPIDPILVAEVRKTSVQPLTKRERREGLVRLATRTGTAVLLGATACTVLPEAIKSVTAVPPTPGIYDITSSPTGILPTATEKPLGSLATPTPTDVLSSVPDYPSVDELPEISTNGGNNFEWGNEIKTNDPNPEKAQLFNQISQAAYEGLSSQYPNLKFDVHMKESQAGYQVWAVGTDGRLYGEKEILFGPDGQVLRDQNGKLIYGNVREVAIFSLLGRSQLEAVGLSNGYRDVEWGQYPPVPIPDGIDPTEIQFDYASIKAKNGNQWIALLVAQARGVPYAVYDEVNNFWIFAKGSGIAAGGAIEGAPDLFPTPTPTLTPTDTATPEPTVEPTEVQNLIDSRYPSCTRGLYVEDKLSTPRKAVTREDDGTLLPTGLSWEVGDSSNAYYDATRVFSCIDNIDGVVDPVFGDGAITMDLVFYDVNGNEHRYPARTNGYGYKNEPVQLVPFQLYSESGWQDPTVGNVRKKISGRNGSQAETMLETADRMQSLWAGSEPINLHREFLDLLIKAVSTGKNFPKPPEDGFRIQVIALAIS